MFMDIDLGSWPEVKIILSGSPGADDIRSFIKSLGEIIDKEEDFRMTVDCQNLGFVSPTYVYRLVSFLRGRKFDHFLHTIVICPRPLVEILQLIISLAPRSSVEIRKAPRDD